MTILPSAAAIGLMLAAAAPAVARDAKPAATATADQRLHYDIRTQRYCAASTVTGAETITGSVLSHRQCRTREQWAALGVVIPRS